MNGTTTGRRHERSVIGVLRSLRNRWELRREERWERGHVQFGENRRISRILRKHLPNHKQNATSPEDQKNGASGTAQAARCVPGSGLVRPAGQQFSTSCLPGRTSRLAATRATWIAANRSRTCREPQAGCCLVRVQVRARFGFAERPFRQNGPTAGQRFGTSCLPRPDRGGSQQITHELAVNHELAVVWCLLRYELRFGFAERPFRQNGPTQHSPFRQHGPALPPAEMFCITLTF